MLKPQQHPRNPFRVVPKDNSILANPVFQVAYVACVFSLMISVVVVGSKTVTGYFQLYTAESRTLSTVEMRPRTVRGAARPPLELLKNINPSTLSPKEAPDDSMTEATLASYEDHEEENGIHLFNRKILGDTKRQVQKEQSRDGPSIDEFGHLGNDEDNNNNSTQTNRDNVQGPSSVKVLHRKGDVDETKPKQPLTKRSRIKPIRIAE